MTTAAAADTLNVPDDLSDEIVPHYVCYVCYPQVREPGIHPGMKGVCGADLVGVTATDTDTVCGTCAEIWYPHMMKHAEEGTI